MRIRTESQAAAKGSLKYRSAWAILPVLLFSMLLSACPLYNPAAFVQHQNGQQTGPNDITLKATQATIAWDPPASGSPVASYILSYRVHGASTWTTLATIAASVQPSYTILRSTTGAGSFDFAVAAVSSAGVSSPLHTSLDTTADPTTGWYLSW